MKNVLKKSDTSRSKRAKHQNILIVLRQNYDEFDTKSVASFEPKIWNALPVNFKSAESFEVFKKC